MDDNYGEESMQTRANDDLFADEFDPIEVEEPAATAPQVTAPAPAPIHTSAQATATPPATRGGRGGSNAGRGRGRGRGSYSAATQQQRPNTSSPASAPSQVPSGLLGSRYAPKAPTPKAPAPKAPADKAPVDKASVDKAPVDKAPAESAPAAESPAPEPPADAPTGPAQSAPTPSTKAPTSVRGDRSSTGGTSRPKLSEEELAGRLASAKLRNATLSAAHERAQADAASFAAREDEAAKRRTEERRDRAQMMGEREKNRLRKLKAQGGREWDSEKVEEEAPRGNFRGANGGVAGVRAEGRRDGPAEAGWEKDYMFKERRGRGGKTKGETRQSAPAPKGEDFPALAAGKATEAKSEGAAPKLTFPSKEKELTAGVDAMKLDEGKAKQSWADMVEEGKGE